MHSLETVCLLFAMKLKYPNRVFLLRGNHESSNVNIDFGFYKQCLQFLTKKKKKILNNT